MKKYLFLFAGLTLLAAPANAITWKEFWEPFDGNQAHHHYHPRPRRPKPHYHPRPKGPSVCHRHFHFHQGSGIIHEDGRHCHGNGYSHHGEHDRHPVYDTPGRYYF